MSTSCTGTNDLMITWRSTWTFRGNGQVDTTSGKHKAYRMPLVVQLFDCLTWYAVGDIDEVQRLCHKVTHIGKKSVRDLGQWTTGKLNRGSMIGP